MPRVEQHLLTLYFLNHINLLATPALSANPENEYLQFIFENEATAREAFTKAGSLFSSVEEKIAKENPESKLLIISENTVSVPVTSLTIKFLHDLKLVVLKILSKATKEYLYPHDYADDPNFCEQIKNTFVIPSIHEKVLEMLTQRFFAHGIRLSDMNYEWARLFRQNEYKLKEIHLSPVSINAAQLVKAVKAYESKPATTPTFPILQSEGLPPLAKKTKTTVSKKLW